ncbi:hypothetical protein TREMEDRAFT_56758 [Tremella mesenterica DSM 1558]|uniref:uncharacterized protein n=1 Tax=Tremella mesenterica (strain ATCC 24925 / CBS 8224 / DSM 1558 / NBRC 9311 / NRRL Y-6157 / RJB 2259-6 / UBC 559-6) TaxID=578456 RepID=UPI0003F4902F|nr:uncharacterized protein TREMEDRAFT_56758 [Tremella mesenterica DSM 1558]EIW69956.1 hypothetical protein TREMEDRAFT_56758 [Tremella mesenterica DSM 1558]
MFTALAIGAAALMAGVANAQVTATGTMGVTNPPKATLGTPINQTSYARLLSLNSLNDFCLFAPAEKDSVIGNVEAEVVAWCIQARNNARVIPDGSITGAQLQKSPLYWQVSGWGDFTKINIAPLDEGGELDPHGATGDGNPVGGNWMNYMSYQQFCLRICIAENATYSAAIECEHTLDEMGCNWVMPGAYLNNSFTECDADAAYPPGVYPLANGSTSTFAQRYTGTYTDGAGSVGMFTIGQTVTPQTAFSTPASSNCVTYSTIGNGIPLSSLGLSGSVPSASSLSGSSQSTGSASTTSSSKSGSASGSKASTSGASSSGSSTAGSAIPGFSGFNYGPIIAAVLSVIALFAGTGAVML